MDVRRARASRRQLVQGAGVAGLALLAGCGALAAHTETAPKVYRIGFLSADTSAVNLPRIAAFRQRLRELGYVEGTNIVIEARWAEGQVDRLPVLAAELARLPVDVLAAYGDVPTRSAKQASGTIPIVMGFSADPVGLGFVASLARPGGNVTGLSGLNRELAGKQLELLKEMLPSLTRVGFFWDSANPGARVSLRNTEVAARLLGVQVESLEVRSPDDFLGAFEAATRQGADAVIVFPGGLPNTDRPRIAELAVERRLPTMYGPREYVQDGGLMSYGPNVLEQFRRTADFVDKVLKGAKPADLPVEQPMTFDFVINLRTAQALGLTIPPQVLLQATEVIQ